MNPVGKPKKTALSMTAEGRYEHCSKIMALQKALANEMETLPPGLMTQNASGLKDVCLGSFLVVSTCRARYQDGGPKHPEPKQSAGRG